ncbi:hypothetical protein TNCV_694461 [Trichonephila clavipes]|nr:hypothetical protein TNCV_694461 [Trichonephila clavipes]
MLDLNTLSILHIPFIFLELIGNKREFIFPQKTPKKISGKVPYRFVTDDMLTKYQMIKFIDFCEVWFLPESVARVATIVGDHRCHTPRH